MQFHVFPVPANNPLPDLLSRLSVLMLRVRVVKLFHANGALGSVRILEATV
jgi:hypothetical protein